MGRFVMKKPQTYGAEEVAEILGISVWAVYEAAKRGALPVIQLSRRTKRFPKARIDKIAAGEVAA
jgi:excisionase family DNA binding protein